MILDLILFFIFTQLIYFSIIGYGNIIFTEKQDANLYIFISFLFGFILLNITGFILYYLNISNQYVNVVVLIIGIIFFIKKNLDKKYIDYIFYNLIFFSGIIISKLHEDWPYHFAYIDQVARFTPVIGIGNVDDIAILSSSFISYLQKILFLPYFNFKLILIPIYLIYLNLIIYLIKELRVEKKIVGFVFLLITSTLLIKINRMSEFGYDYPFNFFLLSLVILFFKNNFSLEKNNLPSTIVYLIIFIYSVAVKVTALFFLPILISIIIFEKKNIEFGSIKLLTFLGFFLISIFFLDNFFKSGCILYFVKQSCFTNLIDWNTDYYRIENHARHVELWAKSFYVQSIQKDPSVYLENLNWFNNWLDNHFFYKIFEFLIIPIIFVISYFLFFKKDKTIKINYNYVILFIGSIISVIFWFLQIPQLRFASTILIFLFCTIVLMFNLKISLKKNIISAMLIILVFIYNVKNLNRILKEFKRNDAYNFINFPFPPEEKIRLEDRQIKFSLYKNKEIKDHKWLKIISNNN